MKSKSDRVKALFSLMTIALVALTFAHAAPTPARTQMDPGVKRILQNGIQVGEIFVPERDPKATRYVEHWVLYNGYVYPGKDNPDVKTEIRESTKSSYESEADFFARVPFGPGFRYVRVDCTESDRLPGR